MGIFNDLKRAIAESPGRVLQMELERKTSALKSADSSVLAASLAGFAELRKTTLSEMRNMTPQGRIKLGVDLQRAGNKNFDFDMAAGFALWAVGAWLEAGERPGHEAEAVAQSLDSLAELYFANISGESLSNSKDADFDFLDVGFQKQDQSEFSTAVTSIPTSKSLAPTRPRIDSGRPPGIVDEGRFRTSASEKAMLKSRFERGASIQQRELKPRCPYCGSQDVATKSDRVTPEHCFSCKRGLSS